MKFKRTILIILTVLAPLGQLVWAVSPELQSATVLMSELKPELKSELKPELKRMCHEQAGTMDMSTPTENCCTSICSCPMVAGAVYGLSATSFLFTSLYQHSSSKIDLYLDGVVLHSVSPLFRPPISV